MRDATFSYWLSGRMISAATDQVTKAWTYDTAGRPVSHTASTPAPNAASYTFTYGWDVAGNLTSVGYPTTVGISGIPNPGTLTATYAYDALNRMTGVTTTGIKAASASLTYDTLSRRKSVTFGDNSTQAYDYEADDDLSSIAHTFVNKAQPYDVTLTYSNDKLGRQVSETTSNSLYLYDPPLAATGAYGAATSLNQYPTVGATTYSYTPNDPALLPSGSVTSDGVRAFFYDEKGNLTKARQGADSANNFDQDYFDALGVRWYSYRSAPAANDTSRIELTDGLRPEVAFELHSTVAEGSTTPVVAGAYYSVLGPNPDERLIWINGTEASLKARYPHTNRRGDTIAIGRDGIAETKFKYGPFGESADSTAGYPWRFTGQRLNGWTGLYHFKARAYAPGIGRFLQPDPIGYGDGPNIYAYVESDPFNKTDPTGTLAQWPPDSERDTGGANATSSPFREVMNNLVDDIPGCGLSCLVFDEFVTVYEYGSVDVVVGAGGNAEVGTYQVISRRSRKIVDSGIFAVGGLKVGYSYSIKVGHKEVSGKPKDGINIEATISGGTPGPVSLADGSVTFGSGGASTSVGQSAGWDTSPVSATVGLTVTIHSSFNVAERRRQEAERRQQAEDRRRK